MSWFSLSVPNPFKFLKQEDEAEGEEEEHHETPAAAELTQIISRELWGAASFLALPSSSNTLAGIRSDLAEIGNGFKAGLFRLCALLNSHPHEIGGGGTVTEGVLEFARDVSARPESWLDFPLALSDDFEMSDAQREHASVVECLTPSFAALRIKLCSHMSEGYFWKIYFLLLQPLLNEHDSEILLNPQITEARSIVKQQLKHTNMEVQRFEADCSSLEVGGKRISIQEESNEDKEYEVMAETTISSQRWSVHSEENVDEWSEDECSEMSASVNDNKQESNKEDVSFSDLEINNDGGGNEFGKIVGSRSQIAIGICGGCIGDPEDCGLTWS
ncbi:hypothetical protein MRB53_013890 [Persea americana]|uniref:Uncharacterized protein n=1 Tax=Persea americana TaxID=3435 RepID=A0ACC2K9A6_PERAE|nr:hypothetical protein MRB53_013890 [Persea americana]